MKRILVTGSEGFLGSHICKRLGQQNNDLWTLDIQGKGEKHFNTPVQEFDRFNEFDTIYHLAAISDPRVCEEEDEKAWTVNVEGTRNLIKQLSSDQRLVFSSSAHVYNKWESKPRSEDDELNPDNFYGVTKKTAEHLITHYSQENGFNYNIFRIFNVYGPKQSEGFLVPDVIQRARESDKVVIRGGVNHISPVYVSDAVDVLMQQLPDKIYNVCQDCVKVAEVYHHIADLMDVSVQSPDQAEEEAVHLCGDSGRIRKHKTDWTGLKEGLHRTIREKIDLPE